MWLVAAFVGAICSTGLRAENAPASKIDLDKAKGTATQVCSACHGPDGNSLITVNPSLAGQVPQYITKQLASFKSGERANPIMMGMAAGLSPDDMRALGVYFGSLPAKPDAAKDRALAEAGAKIYRGGVAAAGVPACSGCHGPDGSGIPAQYPRLAGQHADYTLAQLKGFRAGLRNSASAAAMRTIAGRLSDKDMEALSEYIAGLRQ